MNYEMLVISLKVDEITIKSRVFSKTRIISSEILPLLYSLKSKERSVRLSSGRVLVLHSTVLIIDSYNISHVFLQGISVYSV